MAGIKILPRILESLEEVFVRRRNFISVEIGEDSIKIAEAVISKGRTEIVRLMKRPASLNDEGAAEEIKKILESLNIPHRQARLNIPRHLITVRFLKLPSTDDDEIRKMVRIESLKHIPYADEDIVAGYRTVEKLDMGYSNVLIAVTQADTVRKEIELLKKAGLAIESVSLGSETLLLWYLAVREGEEDSAVLVVNIETGHIDIDIIAGEKLVFTRGVLYGVAKPIAAEKIIEQVNISMAAYKKESDRSVDKVVLSGMPAMAKELKSLLAERLNISVEVIDQMKNVAVAAGASLEPEEASFIELLGLALKYEGTKINLLPETAQEERRLELVKKNIATTLIVSGLIVVMAFGVILKKLHDKQAYISYVDSELAKIEPQVREAKKMAKDIDIVTAKIAEKPLAIDLASEIFKITPSGITLTMMEYESYKTMTLRGTAPNLSDVFKYVTTLEASPYFENVKVKYANKRVSQASNVADFEMICPISRMK